MGGVNDLAFSCDQSLIDALLDYILEDLAEHLLSQSYRPEIADGGIVSYFLINCQPQEILVGQINSGVLDHLPVRVSVDVLQETQSQHKLWIYRRFSKVWGVSVFNEIGDEGKTCPVHDTRSTT